LISLLTLLAVLSAHAQAVPIRATIPHTFTAGGKQLPAGRYEIFRDPASQVIRLSSDDKKNTVLLTTLTRTAAAIHNTPADSHLVFDKMGETYILAELWVPGIDGYVFNTTKEQHEHQVVDVAVK
jgi:hypothetical protein